MLLFVERWNGNTNVIMLEQSPNVMLSSEEIVNEKVFLKSYKICFAMKQDFNTNIL